MSRLTRWMDRHLFGGMPYRFDERSFRIAIQTVLRPDDIVLDLGAGAGIVEEMRFRGEVAKVCGVDPDPRVLKNPNLDEAYQAMGESLPYPEGTFDVVICDNVLEHLERPVEVLTEVRRVLKPGGLFLGKTPNRWHYMPLLAAATPYRFHVYFNRRLGGRASADTFPTRYRANTRAALRRHARAAGLELVDLTFEDSHPKYLRFNALAYLIGWLYHVLVTRLPGLHRFRGFLIVTLQRPVAREAGVERGEGP